MGRIIAVGGGKGGTGKSFVAASIGVLLARQGYATTLVDLDLGAANVHAFLGVGRTSRGLDDFISKRASNLGACRAETPITNLGLISSLRCSLEVANIFYAQKIKLLRAIKRLDCDFAILDLGSGTSFNTLDFFLAADIGLCVATPQPTAVDNTYRFIRAMYLRRLGVALKATGMWQSHRREITRLAAGEINSPLEVLDVLSAKDPGRAAAVHKLLGKTKVGLLVNRIRNQGESGLAHQLCMVCNRHFYPSFFPAGHVREDTRVDDALIGRRIYVQTYPYTGTALDLQNAVKALVRPPDGSSR